MKTTTVGIVQVCVAISFAQVGIAANAGTPGAQSNSPKETNEYAEPGRRRVIEEIIVSATKREERLQDVPFSISAFNTDSLEHIGASGMNDYLSQVPGVAMTPDARSTSAIIIRGVTTVSRSFGSANQPGTEIYIDDVPQTDRAFAWTQPDPDLFDLERVEVLRGPQGTLFGSGALGGAVRMITSAPNLSRFEAKAEAGVETVDGGSDGYALRGMANIPLSEDRLALRVVGYHREDAGWADNIRYGTKDTNEGLGEGARAALLYQPSDAFSVRLSVLYNEEASNGVPGGFRFASDGTPHQNAGFGNVQDYLRMDMQQYALNMDYDLGPATITSVTSYADRSGRINYSGAVPIIGFIAETGYLEPDDSNFDNFIFGSHRFTEELRMSSNGEGRLQWTVGAFLLDYSSHFHAMWYTNDPAVTGIQGRIPYLDQPGSYDLTEKALFGEMTYALSDAFHVTAGARYAWNRFRSNEAAILGNGGPATSFAITETISPAATSKETPFTPRVSVSYFASQNLHFYTTASKGYRTGQPNVSSVSNPAIPRQYGPDSLWNYELGMKSNLFDRRLQFNIAGYFIDWKDIQLNRFLLNPDGSANFFTFHTDNAGEARVKGIEAELVGRPFNWLELGSAATYTDATLESVEPGVLLTPGSRLPGTPKFSMANYVEVQGNIQTVPTFLRLSHRHVGSMFLDIDNSLPLSESDTYDTFGARLGVTLKSVELTAYVENILNSDAVTVGLGADGSALYGQGFEPLTMRLRPRTVGVMFRTNF